MENQVREVPDLTFEGFMGAYGGTGKARHGVRKNRDLLTLSDDYSLAHTMPASIKDSRDLSYAFGRKFGLVAKLQCQLPAPGKSLKLQDTSRYLFYLVTKDIVQYQPTYQDVWDALFQLREHVLESDVQKLAMQKLECRQLDWRIVRNMVEEILKTPRSRY
uniref:ADP-ribose glycohydrolase OARD1-like n=1 Tax=Diabrotica virgifera virgifera TaxID=50390 RepID=A0A6P7H7A6_DIAVI